MTFDECLEEIKRESPEARKCIEIAEGIADIMYKEDYVKVVRCKDCVRHGKWNCPCSETPPAEFWCRSGERRTE